MRVGERRTLRFFLWAALVLLLGALLRLALITFRSPSPLNLFALQICIFAILGLLFSMRTGVRVRPSHPSLKHTESSPTVVKLLRIGFFLCVAFSLLALSQSLYVPLPLYILGIAGGTSILGVEILVADSGKGRIYSLLQIVIIGCLVQAAYPWLNPGSIVSDSAFHWIGTGGIVQRGILPASLNYYLYFPSFHVLNAILIETGSETFGNYALINHLLVVLALPFSYLLTRQVASEKAALMAALILSTTLFFFVWAVVLPSILGACLLVLAIYALAKYHKTKRQRGWVVFWSLAGFVFLSHPVNALILGVVLSVYWVATRVGHPALRKEGNVAPTAAYLVLLLGYLAYIATTAFTIFIQSIFESGPQIRLAQSISGPATPTYLVEVCVNTVSFAALFFPGIMAIIEWVRRGSDLSRFLAGVAIVLLLTPGVVVLRGAGSYGLQAARSLLYLGIFLCVASGGIVVIATASARRPRRAVVSIAICLFVLASTSGVSYLNGGGNRALSATIPVQTNYVTDSMLAARDFINLVPQNQALTLDPDLANYFAPFNSVLAYPATAYPVNHTSFVTFTDGIGNASVMMVLSRVYMINAGPEAPSIQLIEANHPLLVYDNGVVQILS